MANTNNREANPIASLLPKLMDENTRLISVLTILGLIRSKVKTKVDWTIS